jgi:hypothetical protein
VRYLELIDTSVLCELLKVPNKSDGHEVALSELQEKSEGPTELHLPIAGLVEAGNHISKIENGHFRRECALRLARMIEATLARTVPWSFTPLQWDAQFIRELVAPSDEACPSLGESLATSYLEMGDLIVVGEFRRLRDSLDRKVIDVNVWTHDASLRAVIDSIRA